MLAFRQSVMVVVSVTVFCAAGKL